ncbi:MAG: hypothetical protein HW415_1043 [Deltaproteobacteria bacterium]|nr:hypothetical protein [Deltaproteobacteria bacterium]
MNFCRLFYRWVLIVVVAAAMSACGGGGDTGGAGDPGGGGLPASTTKISGTVTLSSIAKSTKGYRGAIMMATSPLNLATVQLYNADKPEWLYPVAETATDSSGNYTLEKLANASNNSGAYTDNDPIPTGNYTIIAYKYSPITLLMSVAVQEYVKKFDGVITGHDLTAYDSSQVPAVVSMFGIVDKNTDGSFGSPSWPLPQNAAIQITFNMAMARSSVLNSVNIKDGLNNSVQGIWKVAPDLLSAVFYPTASLALDTVYTVTVLNTVKNVYGKEITATVTGQFISVASDTTPPNVALAEPAAQTDVPVNTSIILAANEALDINTFSITSTPSIGDKPACRERQRCV